MIFRSRESTRLPSAAILAIVLTAMPLCATPQTNTQAARYYEDALTRYEKKDVAGAIIQLKNALQVDRNMLPVHVLLGKALMARGDVVAAEAAFVEALRLGVNRAEVVLPLGEAMIEQGKQQQLVEDPRFDPSDLPVPVQARLLLLRAGALSDLGKPGEAMKAINNARALQPLLADAWLAEVPLRIRARQFEEAIVAADKAMALAPESPDVQYQRGSIAHTQGRRDFALAAYDKALKSRPEHVEALVSRSGLLLDLGRVSDATRDIEALRVASPADPRGAYLRALLAERAGDAAAAKAALGEVIGLLDPVPVEFLRYRTQLLILGGLSHYGLGNNEKAKQYLEAVLRQGAGSPVAKVLAQIYLSEKRYDKAGEVLDGYLRGAPNDGQALALLASAQMAQGRYARATQLLQRGLQAGDSPQLRTALGLSLIGSGAVADAVTELEAAYRKDPTQTEAAAALAVIYLQRGQAAKAVTVVESLAKRNPGQPGIQNLLGMAKSQAGELAGARTAFERAEKLDDKFVAPQLNLARLDIAAKAYDAAAARLNKLLKANDKQVEPLIELAVIAERRGQMADATRLLEKADDVSGPSDPRAALALVDYHLRGNRPEAALAATKRLGAKAPDDVTALVITARAELATKNASRAKAALARASQSVGFDAPRQVQIALLQLAAGDAPGAAYGLDKALSAQPEFLPAAALMVDVNLQLNEVSKAEQIAKQIAARHPKLALGSSLQGDVAAAKGQWPIAAEFYRKAHQIEPSTGSVLRLFRALNSNNATPAALRLVEDWSRIHPQDVAVRKTLADAQARAGHFAAARAGYEAVLKTNPQDAEAANNLVNVLILTKDSTALAVAEAALLLNPDLPQLLGSTGWAAFHAGNSDRALQLLRNARLRDPSNCDTRYFLAAVLAKNGRSVEARSELEASLQACRTFASAADAESLLRTLK